MEVLNIERIYLLQIAKLINRKDARPARTWCEKNNVNVYKDSTGEEGKDAESQGVGDAGERGDPV